MFRDRIRPGHVGNFRKHLRTLGVPQNDLPDGKAVPLFRGSWTKFADIEFVGDSLVLLTRLGPLKDQLECLKLLWVGCDFSIQVHEAVRRIPFWFS